MEFGSGHEVRPGHDITVETATGTHDLGAATYDSDHDGVGDSVILIEGGHEYLITDADHDGRADWVRTFDSTGSELDPATGGAGVSPGHGMIFTGADGIGQYLGVATVDLDRDGRPDTAVVREADGGVTGYTDRDGDGTADQITRIGPAGDVRITVSDGRGGWETAATGHLDDSGTLMQDPPTATPAPPTT